MDKKKISGYIGLAITAAISALITNYMNEKEIKKQVREIYAEERKKLKEES